MKGKEGGGEVSESQKRGIKHLLLGASESKMVRGRTRGKKTI